MYACYPATVAFLRGRLRECYPGLLPECKYSGVPSIIALEEEKVHYVLRVLNLIISSDRNDPLALAIASGHMGFVKGMVVRELGCCEEAELVALIKLDL